MSTTAEWVSPAHPDKVADRIASAIVDSALFENRLAQVNVEVMGERGQVSIAGKIRGVPPGAIPYEKIVHRITGRNNKLDCDIEYLPNVSPRSKDTGICIGFATLPPSMYTTGCCLPRAYYLAKELGQAIYAKRPFDGKVQITLQDNGIHVAYAVVTWSNVATKELENTTRIELRVFGGYNEGTQIIANPAGERYTGGFERATGATGRKIPQDLYGASVPVSGGSLWGKDPTQVDVVGNLYARKIALRELYVAERDMPDMYIDSGIVRLAYAGQDVPIDARVELYRAGDLVDVANIQGKYDFTIDALVEELELRTPFYEALCVEGVFGGYNEWERMGFKKELPANNG